MPPSKPADVLITGATGALGPRVVGAFLAAGHNVRALSLDTPETGYLPDSVDARIGDVTDKRAVASALQGIETVIHMAALLHIVDPPPHLRERYEQVNVGGTATLVEQAVMAGVRRIVLFSTIAVYGSAAKGQVLDEGTPPSPETLYARSKLDAERLVLAAIGSDGQPLGTVLRMAAIYGSRVKGNYRRLVGSLARGRFVPIGAGINRRALVYDRDAAQAAVLAGHHPAAAGEIFNVTDGHFHTLSEIIASICQALGRRPPRFSAPVGPTRIVAGVLEDAARLLGRQSPVKRAMVDK